MVSINYDYSIPFDTELWGTSKEVEDAIQLLAKEILSLGKIKRWQRRYTDHLKIIVMNLYNAHLISPNLFVAYSRNKADYGSGSRYDGYRVKYDSVVKMIDCLSDERLKYLEGVKGKHYSHFKRRARVKATKNMISLFSTCKFNPLMIGRHPDEEIIILKDTKQHGKKLLDYEDTAETIRMRNNLSKINSLIESNFISLCIDDTFLAKPYKEHRSGDDDDDEDISENTMKVVDFSKTRLKRVFNNDSFEQGGRFYHGWWLRIPRWYRRHIRINGKTTIEVDFSGLHINLLYAESGLPLPEEDVYKLENVPPEARDFLKKALNIALNSENKRKAIKAIEYRVKTEEDFPKVPEGHTANGLLEKLIEKHDVIKQHFFSGCGVKLHYIDSEIAEEVMLRLADKCIPVLPVHDSFIVSRINRDDLMRAMNEAVYNKYRIKFKLKEGETNYNILFGLIDDDDIPETIDIYEETWEDRDKCQVYFNKLNLWLLKGD